VKDSWALLRSQRNPTNQAFAEDRVLGVTERSLSDLLAESRHLALEARKEALRRPDDRQKQEWLKIAMMWEIVAEGLERLVYKIVN